MAVGDFGVDSEYGRLSTVLLYVPGPEINGYADPDSVQHLGPIQHPALVREFDSIVAAFRTLGIVVVLIDATPLDDDRRYLYNLMYCRDLFFMTPRGAILANMANNTRLAEPRYAGRILKSLGIPLLHTVCDEGRFEGADAVWLRDYLVLVGVGNRTNRQGYRQVKKVLEQQGVECLQVPSYQTRTQHLLGTLQLVDHNLILLRHEIVDRELVLLLETYGFRIVPIPENREVRTSQAMNIVSVAPRTIIMTAGCPETRALFEAAGLTIAAELELAQLMQGAGGLACATGIVARDINHPTALTPSKP
jgi:N-dimethylarginine dimethylaminohydrolase